MAPEQLLGTSAVGPWTDLYAYGVMLAYVLTGRSVFDADVDLSALAARKLEPTTLGPDVAMREGLEVPDALRQLVARLLAPHPRQRLRFAAEVRAELLDATAHVGDSVPRTAHPRPTRRDGGDTTIDPSFEATVLPERVLSPAPAASDTVVLPIDLPAPEHLDHGVSLSQLRETSLVGREPEQEHLESLVATVLAEGGAHVLLLEGEAGIGKSRLARWGLAEVERTGAMEGAAGGYDLGGSGAAGGLRHALQRLLGAPPPRTDPSAPEPALAAWQWLADASVARSSSAGLGRTSQSGDPELDRALLARFVRADVSQETLAQEEIARLAHAALRALGRLRPIYLWLDDVGWSRDGALALVERLLDADDTPILVVATLRTDAPASEDALARLERLRAHARTTTRTLEGLSDDAIEALAQEIVPLAPGVARSIAAIVPRSPMLLRAALREWVESGVLVSGPEGHAPRPGSEIERVIGARPIELLVASCLERLIASFGDGAELAEGVLVRAALLGARLERPALEAAVAASPALGPLLDPLRWLSAEPQYTARLWLARANAHYFALRYDEAVRAVQRARREATAIDDRHLALRCDALFADISFYQDRLATAQRTALELLDQLDPEDPEHAAVAATLAQRLSDLEVLRGDLDAALEWRERCLAMNLAAQRPWRARIARLNVAEIHVATGRHAEARSIFDEVLADAQRDRDDDGAAACIDSRAHLELVTGHAERAREVNDPLLARLEAKGDLWRLTSARMVDAVASVYLDPAEEIAVRVAAFVAAYRKVPHDDAFTTYGTTLLERELARRGLEPLRASVEALLTDRRKQLSAGFSR
jgi:tetratricopeptide (TPR) repeat protein